MTSGSLLVLFAAALLLEEGLLVLLYYAGREMVCLGHTWRGHVNQVLLF